MSGEESHRNARDGHQRRQTNMDIFFPVRNEDDEDDEDAPSPIPSPYVGTLIKGSRRRRQQRQNQRIVNQEDESDDEGVHTTKDARQRSNSLDHTQTAAVDKFDAISFSFPLQKLSSEHSPLLVSSQKSDDDDDDDNSAKAQADRQEEYDNLSYVATILGTMGESAVAAYHELEEAVEEAMADYEERRHYNWREFWKGGSCLEFFQWIVTGLPSAAQSADELQDNLNSLARMIVLLREYHEKYGTPSQGGPRDQAYVIREVTKDLYAGGCPIWALQPALKTAAEGLTGRKNVEFFILPRRVFLFDEGSSQGGTSMFAMTRGYDMRRLDDMEAVAVRLASFASNTSSSGSVPVRWAQPSELRQAFRSEVLMQQQHQAGSSGGNASTNVMDDGDDEENPNRQLTTPEELATEILDLASEAEGLFFFLNAHRAAALRGQSGEDPAAVALKTEIGAFWKVDETLQNLFSHLACIEAMQNIDKMDVERKPLYSPWTVTIFRVGASAGACAFWFNGGWLDIVVSGLLAVLIAWIGSSPLLTSQERIIFEAVASFIVGMVAALVALTWPTECCFGAMAISGVLDLLQGFRVVYSIIEIMSRHTVAGGADFLEGVFFTTLIAYFLRFGQFAAIKILGKPENDDYMRCNKGVNRMWYFVFVPIAAISWSGLFNPYRMDLPFMALHGILGYLVSLQFYQGPFSQLNNFLAAVAVTFSAGIFSRFSGRQALGNTVAGIYVLLPGAYLVDEVFKNRLDGFLASVIVRACIIGVGAWTGTVLCSPTLLGRSKTNAATGASLGAPALTGPLGLQRAGSDSSFAPSEISSTSIREDGRWTRRRRRRNQQLFMF